ncbi:MAG: (2Fe-2S) ferredoxin domain-containing protein [Bacteroidota bacterium]|nr:(2Fe-2S) ferredoxin domain-containing protein [Bacteroidota bacterium]
MRRFQKHIFVCTNERPKDHPKGCCLHKGSAKVRDKLKGELKTLGLSSIIRINNSGCLDACEYGATMVIYPEAVWYGGVTVDDVEDLVSEHILHGRVVERLKINNLKFDTDTHVEPVKR